MTICSLSKSTPALAAGLFVFMTAGLASAAVPTAEKAPANAPPPVPAGMKVTCTPGPDKLNAATDCPVLRWNGYTYWAYSYNDNRVGMGIVAYDPGGKLAATWERSGARYVNAITVDPAKRTVAFVGQSSMKISMTFDELFPPPVVNQMPVATPLALPPGTKVTCTKGPNTGESAATCPVLRWGGYTYWALSYDDNRVSMAIAAYDSKGALVKVWDKPGARYVYGITVNKTNRTVVFAGQSDSKISMTWSELLPPGNRWERVAGPAGATVKQVSVGNAGYVWVLDTAGTPWRWTGAGWTKHACCVTSIAAAADNSLWATNPPDALRVLRYDLTQAKWTYDLPTGMTTVTAIGATKAWGLDNSGSHFELVGNSWVKKGCCVTQIEVGSDGELWATHPPDGNRVLRWGGAAWTYTTAGNIPLPTGMTQVAVGDAKIIWALNAVGEVFRWNGTAWQLMPGNLKSISVAADGTVWGVNAEGTIWQWIP